MPVYDIIGTELKVGRKVCFGLAQTKTMAMGVITKINPKTVAIEHIERRMDYHTREWYDHTTSCLREFDNVIVYALEHACGTD